MVANQAISDFATCARSVCRNRMPARAPLPPLPPWSRALERAVRADRVCALRDLLAEGESPVGRDAQGTTLASLANEHSSACYRLLCDLPELDGWVFPTYLSACQVYARANPNNKVGFLLLCILSGDVMLQLNLMRRYGPEAWAQHPVGDLDTCVWTALIALFLPLDVLRSLDEGLADASAEAVCATVCIESERVQSETFAPSQVGHRVRAALDVYVRPGRDMTAPVVGALEAVLAGVEDADARACAVLTEALLAADAALQSAAVPIADPMDLVLSRSERNATQASWESSFLWTSCRTRAVPRADCAHAPHTPPPPPPPRLCVRLEVGVRVVPLQRCVPKFVSHRDDHFGIDFLVAPGQLVAVGPGGAGIVVRPSAAGACFFHENEHGERVARRLR